MKKTKIIAAIIAVMMGAFGLNTVLVSNHAYAGTEVKNACDPSVPEPVRNASGCGGDASADLRSVIVNILNGVIGILSLVAVIFIIVGGVNYMTSTGEAAKIQKAKNTILYAVIGLIICILAFAIVNFVVNNILQGGGEGESGETTEVETNTRETHVKENNDNSNLSGGGPSN